MSRPADVKSVEQAEAERELKEAEADRSFAQTVLSREIDWRGYEAEGILNKKELSLLLDYDKQSATEQKDLLNENGAAYIALFVKILNNINKKETVEYVIFLIDSLLELSDKYQLKYVSFFHQLSQQQIDPCQPFLRILTSPELGYNPYTLSRITHILSIILSTAPLTDELQPSIIVFVQHLIAKINALSSSSPSISSNLINRDLMSCLIALKALLYRETIQQYFFQNEGFKSLCHLLNKDIQNAQLLYIVGFNIWLLSYTKAYCVSLQELGIIRKLVSIVKVNVMEKVIRICFSILRNFLEHQIDSFNEEMIGHGLVQVVETLLKRKFKDPDVVVDMSLIQETLAETIKRLSTFEMYHSEVMSGNLSWTPAHKNEVFWRENIQLFENQNFQLVQRLISLMADEEDLIREVACYDVGEFARFHADGKKIVQRHGGKLALMKNLQHKNPKVAKAALLATQKLMVANWEFLNKSSSGGVASLVAANKKN